MEGRTLYDRLIKESDEELRIMAEALADNPGDPRKAGECNTCLQSTLVVTRKRPGGRIDTACQAGSCSRMFVLFAMQDRGEAT